MMKNVSMLHYIVHKDIAYDRLDDKDVYNISVHADSKMIEHTIEQDLKMKLDEWGYPTIKLIIEADKERGLAIRDWTVATDHPEELVEKIKRYFDGIEGASCTVCTNKDLVTVLEYLDPEDSNDDFRPIKDAVTLLASKHMGWFNGQGERE